MRAYNRKKRPKHTTKSRYALCYFDGRKDRFFLIGKKSKSYSITREPVHTWNKKHSKRNRYSI